MVNYGITSGDVFSLNCLPSKIFLLISFFSVVASLYKKFTIGKMFSSIIGTLLWFYLLHLLCKNNYPKVSWFLILPTLIGMFIMLYFQYLKKK